MVADTTLSLGGTCKKAIFIGSVGALDLNIGIGDIVIPEYSVCGDGVCRYLGKKRLKDNDMYEQPMYPDAKLTCKIKSATREAESQ